MFSGLGVLSNEIELFLFIFETPVKDLHDNILYPIYIMNCRDDVEKHSRLYIRTKHIFAKNSLPV